MSAQSDIHSCSYYCDRPECIKVQRDELRNAIAALHTDLAYYQAKWENELSTVSKIERERDALREEVSRLISATLYVPKYQWQWCLNGEWNSVVFNVVSAPNAFNRLMQKWILGIHWRKIK